MFDIQEDLEFDYIPTAMAATSSNSMKKLTKKQTKAVPKQPALTNKSKTKDQFDDLLDGLSVPQTKKPSKPFEKKATIFQSKNSFDDIEPYFEQVKSNSLDKTKQASTNVTAPSNSFLKTSIPKKDSMEQIIHEDTLNSRFGKTQSSFNNTSKVEEPLFVSNRNMKPPLKKKDTTGSTSNVAWSMGNVVLTIPEEQKSIVSSSKQEEDEIIRPPPRLMSKRSIESKIDKKDEQPVLSLNPTKSESPLRKDFQFDNKKDKKDVNILQPYDRTASLTLEQPKEQKKYVGSSIYQADKKINKIVQKTEQKIQSKNTGLNLNVEQSYTLKDSPSYLNQATAADWDKQIQQMKANFQKQVDFLQQNLDRQISINRETREKIIKDSNKMIEEQRQRSSKLHEEQIKRMKDLFQWEKKRMQDTYQAEIQTLRQSLELANKTSGFSYKNNSASKEDISYLQTQLKTQKRILQDRQKVLEQRQRDFQQRQIEINRQRRQEQQRLRSQQKRLIEQDAKWKKQVMNDKKIMADEKQKIAMEAATLQLQAIKKMEKADINLKQNSIDHHSIENQRNELRIINVELMRKYKAKLQELQSQKQRVRSMQQQLIKQLRVLQLKSKQMKVLQNANNKSHSKKQNNWINDNKLNSRGVSTDKQKELDSSMENVARTKERFHQLPYNRVNISVQDNKKFNLDSYMMTVQQYNKLKSDL